MLCATPSRALLATVRCLVTVQLRLPADYLAGSLRPAAVRREVHLSCSPANASLRQRRPRGTPLHGRLSRRRRGLPSDHRVNPILS